MDWLNRGRSAGGRAAVRLESVGFTSVRLAEYFDPFGGTSKERVARKYGVRGVNVHALRP